MLCLLVGQVSEEIVLRVVAVEGDEHALEAHLAATGSQYGHHADILYADRRSDYVQIGIAQLVARQTIRIVFVLLAHSVHVAQRTAAQVLEHTQVRHQRHLLYLRLVDSGYTAVEPVERQRLQVALERITIQLHVVQTALLHQRLHAAAIVGYLRTDTAELIVRHLQYSRQTVDTAQVLTRYLHAGFVTRIVVD